MLLAEANQWPEDAVAYFGNGDESHMNFHFPLMPRMFMSLQMEDRFPIIDILDQTPADSRELPVGDVPAQSRRAHARNGDRRRARLHVSRLRERSARRASISAFAAASRRLLANSRRKIELLNILLFSMPGTPVLYYGDEIGMGDNFYLGDRNGVRTPMQWSRDRNAGFSKANPQQLYLPITIDPEYHYEAINVENQQKNLSSLLWWMRRVIAMRKNFKAFSRGSLEFLYPENRQGAGLSAPARRRDDSRGRESFALFASGGDRSLALRRLRADGSFQSELFSADQGNRPIRSRSARTRITGLSCGRRPRAARASQERVVPTLDAAPNLETLLANGQRARFEREILPDYIRHCRWFGAKARTIREMRITEEMPISAEGTRAILVPRSDLYRRRAGDLRAAGPDRDRRGRARHRAGRAARRHCAIRRRRRKRSCTTRSGTRLSASNFSDVIAQRQQS